MSREQSKRTIPCPPKCIARMSIVAGMGTVSVVLMDMVRANNEVPYEVWE